MELGKFLNILKKHRYGIVALPLLVMALTFFLVRRLPDVYVSKGRLSSGIADGAQQLLAENQNVPESKINQSFSNLVQTMQLKTVFDQVSYQLILHELTAAKPFKTPSKLLSNLNPEAKKHAIEVYSDMYAKMLPLSLNDTDQKGLNEVLVSMKFDYESLKDKIKIYRIENSDFIDVEYESENPQLSAFVINTLCKEFITYSSSLTQQSALKAIDFLSGLMNRKKDSLDRKMSSLKNFKIQKRVLNLNEQAKSLYAQIADFETKQEIAEKEVDANTGAIKEIDAKFDVHEKKFLEDKLDLINRDIVSTQEQLSALNDQYIASNFDSSIKVKIDAIKAELAQKINESSDKYILTPLASKENLVTQKLKLEIDLELAKSSIKSLKDAIVVLNRRLDLLVPNEAVIQAYEGDINVADQEYIEILKKYNQTSMEFSSSVKIKQVEMALPGVKQPSKKIVLVVLAGVVSVVVYLLLLFVLFYLDESVKTTHDLASKTGMRVLGRLPHIVTPLTHIQKIWSLPAPGKDAANGNPDMEPANQELKKLLRSARFEINEAMGDGRNLVLTSLRKQEGKSMFVLSIANAFAAMNKKVLLIDGNFLNPGITATTHPKYFIEDYLTGKTSLSALAGASILGNHGNDTSLFEISGEEEIKRKLQALKDVFDIVIIEAPALETLNQSKEWIQVADNVACVFEANRTIPNNMKGNVAYLTGLEGKFIGWILNKKSKSKD